MSFTGITTPVFTPLYETGTDAIPTAYPAGFDPQMAMLMGQACLLTYMQYGSPGAPITLADLSTVPGVSSYQTIGNPLTWTESIGTGTPVPGVPQTSATVLPGSAGYTTVPFGFAFAALDSDGNPVFNVIAFRGTRSYSEWISDTDAIPTVCSVAKGPTLLPAIVHGGFYNLYSGGTAASSTLPSLATQVYTLLGLIKQSIPQGGKPVPLYITGHSLGGALAELCAADVGSNWYDTHHTGYFSALYEYSLASPLVAAGISTDLPIPVHKTLGVPTSYFTQVFANAVKSGGAWRVVNAADLIPVLPASLGAPGGWGVEFAPSIPSTNTVNFLVQTGVVLQNHDCALYAGFLNQLPLAWSSADQLAARKIAVPAIGATEAAATV